MTDTETKVRLAFHSQGKACALLGSPFMGRLMPLLGQRLTTETSVGARILAWDGDVGPAGQSVPLRTAGALHALVLDQADAALSAVYPPQDADDETLWAAVDGAMQRHADRIHVALDTPPQTNEVRRAVALLPAIWWLLARTGACPVALSELGASAGLNLNLDQFGIETPQGSAGPSGSAVQLRPDWRNTAIPTPQTFDVIDRAGVDRNPIDVRDPSDVLRLTSYLWPDQPERLALTRGAIAMTPPKPDAGDAVPWLQERLQTKFPGALHVVYTTIAWQYFPPESQAACTAALDAAGAQATHDSPLAHVAFEADGRRDGAALTLRLWPHAPEPQTLARADFHGRWVDWHV